MRARSRSPFPVHGWIGLHLVAIFWILNWGLDGLRTHWGFFPLWLGYCLTVDGLTRRARGSSLLTRNPLVYGALFLVSLPAWWIFEAVNLRTRNWHYQGADAFTDLEFALFASLSFSTVVPAVLGTAELIAGTGLVRNRKPRGGRFWNGGRFRSLGPWTAAGAGISMLALVLAWPRTFYPLTWGFMWCLAETGCLLRGVPALLTPLGRRDPRPLIALALGGIVCGFFWEMWNYWSYPRWVYSVPGVEFAYVFEMPLLGYLGYIPFALGLYSLTRLLLPSAAVALPGAEPPPAPPSTLVGAG